MPDFTIEEWEPEFARVTEQVATAVNLRIARAAYEATVKERPGSWITLRHGARVIEEHKPTGFV